MAYLKEFGKGIDNEYWVEVSSKKYEKTNKLQIEKSKRHYLMVSLILSTSSCNK